MANIPKPDMILAGFLLQIFVADAIRMASDSLDYSGICTKKEIAWVSLIAISAGVAIVTAIKSKCNKGAQGVVSFVGSLVLNLSGYNLGYISLACTGFGLDPYYTFLIIPIMAIASFFICVHYLMKGTIQGENTGLPAPELILLGVCAQYAVSNLAFVIYPQLFCMRNGIVSWVGLVIVSGVIALISHLKNSVSRRSLFTFVGSFIVNFSLGGIGGAAILCSGNEDMFVIYAYVTMGLHVIAALIITIVFLKKNLDPPQNHNAVVQNAHSYPVQASFPPLGACPPQGSYPSKASCIPLASDPPQGSYPLQGSSPPQGSYPPHAPNTFGAFTPTAQPSKDAPPPYSKIRT